MKITVQLNKFTFSHLNLRERVHKFHIRPRPYPYIHTLSLIGDTHRNVKVSNTYVWSMNLDTFFERDDNVAMAL